MEKGREQHKDKEAKQKKGRKKKKKIVFVDKYPPLISYQLMFLTKCELTSICDCLLIKILKNKKIKKQIHSLWILTLFDNMGHDKGENLLVLSKDFWHFYSDNNRNRFSKVLPVHKPEATVCMLLANSAQRQLGNTGASEAQPTACTG